MATQDEITVFLQTGRNIMTGLAIHARQLKEWAEAFEQRGGGDTFGSDATEIVYLNNDLQAFLDATKRATIARLRTDV